MDNNSNNSQNRSMYIYTALIFLVALLLIIIAFFGQTNISNNQKNVETVAEAVTEAITETITEEPTEASTIEASPTPAPEQDDYAKLSNAFEALSSENEALKGKVTVYELLLSANKSVTENDFETAKATLSEINPDTLTDEQRVLYNQITTTINQ